MAVYEEWSYTGNTVRENVHCKHIDYDLPSMAKSSDVMDNFFPDHQSKKDGYVNG